MRAVGPIVLFFLGVVVASCLGGDDGSLPGLGEACEADRSCREGFCYDRAGRRLCTTVCKSDAACWEGAVCVPEPSLGNRICLPGTRCSDDEDCPLGHRCDSETRVCHLAVERDLCGACTTDTQCPEGGICVRVRATGERFCSRPCADDEDCPNGFGCRALVQDGVAYDGRGAPRQCIPLAETCNARKPLCSPCAGDAECGSALDLCLEDRSTGVRRCGRSCRPSCLWDENRHGYFDRDTGAPCTSGCPPGFGCLDVGGATPQCVPEHRSCDDFCDASTPIEERVQCGPGRACDRSRNRCVPAIDGRSCAPCDRGTCPAGEGRPSVCLVNHDRGESFCAAACESDEACWLDYGLGFSCVDVEGRRLCLPDAGSCQVGMAPLGASCERGDECAGAICIRHGSAGFCSGPCGRDADCGDARWICCARDEEGYDCSRPPEGGEGVCAPRGGRFGDACGPGLAPCEDGYCLRLGSERVCTASCATDADCDAASGSSGAYRCIGALVEGPGFERVDVCFPAGGGGLGSDCTFGPAACADGICLERTHGRICSKACWVDDCPPGWRCDLAPTTDGTKFPVCLPQ